LLQRSHLPLGISEVTSFAHVVDQSGEQGLAVVTIEEGPSRVRLRGVDDSQEMACIPMFIMFKGRMCQVATVFRS